MDRPQASLDPDALRYQEHWQPVLDAAAGRLLDRVADAAGSLLGGPGPAAGQGQRRVLLDIGAGTGALTLRAATRWPSAAIVGLDASSAMLAMARQRASAAGLDDDDRLSWQVADAASMPIANGGVDVVVSSFVLQLVDDRAAVLGEIHRALRSGGLFGFVTWIAEELQMGADVEFDEAVYELELDDPESIFREPKPGDYEGLDEARDELAGAGFADIDVRADRLSHSWTPDAYLVFKESYDERELFDSLGAADRTRLLEQVRKRWASLPPAAFTLEAPLVSGLARRR